MKEMYRCNSCKYINSHFIKCADNSLITKIEFCEDLNCFKTHHFDSNDRCVGMNETDTISWMHPIVRKTNETYNIYEIKRCKNIHLVITDPKYTLYFPGCKCKPTELKEKITIKECSNICLLTHGI